VKKILQQICVEDLLSWTISYLASQGSLHLLTQVKLFTVFTDIGTGKINVKATNFEVL
jgi:hypothetical protein